MESACLSPRKKAWSIANSFQGPFAAWSNSLVSFGWAFRTLESYDLRFWGSLRSLLTDPMQLVNTIQPSCVWHGALLHCWLIPGLLPAFYGCGGGGDLDTAVVSFRLWGPRQQVFETAQHSSNCIINDWGMSHAFVSRESNRNTLIYLDRFDRLDLAIPSLQLKRTGRLDWFPPHGNLLWCPVGRSSHGNQIWFYLRFHFILCSIFNIIVFWPHQGIYVRGETELPLGFSVFTDPGRKQRFHLLVGPILLHSFI